MIKTILVTGGAGYIGSHTAVELIEAGYDVVLVDNLSNSKPEVMGRLKQITGKDIPFIKADVRDKEALSGIFLSYKIDAVIHFAGLKAVGESVAHPLDYYRNNIGSTLSLGEVMHDSGVKNLLFSSSATVYGSPSELPLTEKSRVGVDITNPYGRTKYMLEEILADLCVSDKEWRITNLRYFNPIGAHESGLIGEDPNGMPNNLLPYVAQVAAGKLEKVSVFGDDYDTPDGTGVRDYIHVVDLAKGHVAALRKLEDQKGLDVYNLGTGKGISVMDIIHAFELASGKNIAYEVVGRRPGDIASCYADCAKANNELHWKAEKSLEEACRDSWKWQQYISSASA
ncbi:UDP-glucose 4-epimerase GalE [soil metagenome]